LEFGRSISKHFDTILESPESKANKNEEEKDSTFIKRRVKESKEKENKISNILMEKLNQDNSNKIVNVLRTVVVKKVVEREEYDIILNSYQRTNSV